MKTRCSSDALGLLRRLLLPVLAGVALAAGTAAKAQPFAAGTIVSTNFGFQNRFLWTNDNGQVFSPSNTAFRLSDFDGKIVFFVFFDVW